MKTADAEVAKSTGGMIALYPAFEYVEKLALPGGEPVEDIHLTLASFGEDVSGMHPGAALSFLDDYTDWMSAYQARVFAHATFNPDEYKGRETCAVYLVGDNPELQNVQGEIVAAASGLYEIPEQHSPWIPHITAGYGFQAKDLAYVGDIVFDRLVLEWGPETHEYQLDRL